MDGTNEPGSAVSTSLGQPPRLVFERVTRRFPKRGQSGFITAVQDVSLSAADGEVVAVIGPSGCGKSTLLGMASGLDRPTSGIVRVDGEVVDGPNAHVAFMLQRDLLLPWRSIQRNVEFGLEIQGLARAARAERARGLLAQMGLSEFADVFPHQVSGGMRQRAAIARTLAGDPDVLLLDEPFSALDAQTKLVLQADLARTLARAGKTALLITHDLEEAVALSDRVLVMSARPGRITTEITVEMPDRDQPLARRRHPRMAGYVDQLMSLLHIGAH
jgi:NitT/TauT family transport system ATP-binding protein